MRSPTNVLLGEEAIMKYCYDLAHTGGLRVAQVLGTEIMDNNEHTLIQCCFVNIRLPLAVEEATTPSTSKGVLASVPQAHVSTVTNYLASAALAHSTFIAFIFYRNAWWARFSAQIYLDLDDFDYGGRVLKALCDSVAQREYESLPRPVMTEKDVQVKL